MVKLANINEFEDGQSKGIDVEGYGRKIILVKHEEEFFAYLDACPHYEAGTPLAYKKDMYLNKKKTRLVCFAHGAQFEIKTGNCIVGPCLGLALQTMKIKIDTAGDIYLVA